MPPEFHEAPLQSDVRIGRRSKADVNSSSRAQQRIHLAELEPALLFGSTAGNACRPQAKADYCMRPLNVRYRAIRLDGPRCASRRRTSLFELFNAGPLMSLLIHVATQPVQVGRHQVVGTISYTCGGRREVVTRIASRACSSSNFCRGSGHAGLLVPSLG